MIGLLTGFARDSLIYGISGVLSRFIGFFLLPIYTRVFNPVDYGVMELVSIVFSVVIVFIVLGTDSALGFYFYRSPKDQDRRDLISTLLGFQVSIGVLVGVILFGTADWVAYQMFGSSDPARYLQIIAIDIVPALAVSLCLFVLRMERKASWYMFFSVGSLVLNVTGALGMVVYLRMGLEGVYLAKLLSDLVLGIVGLIIIRQWLSGRMVVGKLRDLLSYGFPLVPATIALWVTAYVDRYFLQYYTTTYEVGIYSVGTKVASAMSLLVTGFQLGWGPFAFSIQHQPEARVVYARVLSLFLAVTCWAATVLSVMSPLLLKVLAPTTYHLAWVPVPWLSFSLVFYGAYFIVSIGVNLSQKTKYISWTTSIAAAVNVVLNFWLIPAFGSLGAGLATLIAQMLSALLLLRVSQHFFPIPYDLWRALAIVGAAGTVTFTAMMLPEWSGASLVFKILAMCSPPGSTFCQSPAFARINEDPLSTGRQTYATYSKNREHHQFFHASLYSFTPHGNQTPAHRLNHPHSSPFCIVHRQSEFGDGSCHVPTNNREVPRIRLWNPLWSRNYAPPEPRAEFC